MAGKRSSKQSSRSRQSKNGKRSAKGKFSKRQLNKVEEVIDKRLEETKETKYVNDGLNSYLTLTEASQEVDLANSRVFKKIPIVILEGDDYGTRNGDKVMLKTLQLRFRVKPQDAYDFVQLSQNTPAQDWFSQAHFKGHILRVDKHAVLTAGEVDECLRRPTENWMDTRQTAGRSMRKAFTVVHKFELPLKYRDVSGLNSAVIPPEMWHLRIPQITHKSVIANINKKLLFNAVSGNEPVKYDYYLFMTYRDYRADAYTNTVFPAYINYWTSYTFKEI